MNNYWLHYLSSFSHTHTHTHTHTYTHVHSFDEHALIDLPTMIDFALSISGQEKLYYVGHSQATTMGFIAFSCNQILALKIIEFYALAPAANSGHTKGLFTFMSKHYKELEVII